MSKVFDFDQFWAEAMPEEAKRPRVRIFGEDIVLPVSVPARVMLMALRAAEAEGEAEKAFSSTELLKLVASFYGSERVERWLDQGMTLEQLADVFRHTLELYNQRGESDGEGNGPKTGAAGGQS